MVGLVYLHHEGSFGHVKAFSALKDESESEIVLNYHSPIGVHVLPRLSEEMMDG